MTDSYVLLGILSKHMPKTPLGVAHTVADEIVDTFRPVIDEYRAEANRQRDLHIDACDVMAQQTRTIMGQANTIDDLRDDNDRLSSLLRAEQRRTAQPAPVIEQVQVSHAALVRIALSVPEITNALKDNKKIVAIKALRSLVSCGLKEAKFACDEAVLSVIRN